MAKTCRQQMVHKAKSSYLHILRTSKEKESIFLPNKNEALTQFIVSALLGIVPVFIINMVLFNISPNNLEKATFLVLVIISLSCLYVIYMIACNLLKGNTYNSSKFIVGFFNLLSQCLHKPVFMLRFLGLILFFVAFSFIFRSIIITLLDLTSLSLSQTILIVIAIWPILTYGFNISLGVNKDDNYSFFSTSMFRSFTLAKLLLMCTTVSLFFVYKPLYHLLEYLCFSNNNLNIVDSKILNAPKEVNLKTTDTCNLDSSKLQVFNSDSNRIKTVSSNKFASAFNSMLKRNFGFITSYRYKMSSTQFEAFCNYKSCIVKSSSPFNHSINTTSRLGICKQAYNILSPYNKLVLMSSKNQFMALDICNRAYYILHKHSKGLVAINTLQPSMTYTDMLSTHSEIKSKGCLTEPYSCHTLKILPPFTINAEDCNNSLDIIQPCIVSSGDQYNLDVKTSIVYWPYQSVEVIIQNFLNTVVIPTEGLYNVNSNDAREPSMLISYYGNDLDEQIRLHALSSSNLTVSMMRHEGSNVWPEYLVSAHALYLKLEPAIQHNRNHEVGHRITVYDTAFIQTDLGIIFSSDDLALLEQYVLTHHSHKFHLDMNTARVRHTMEGGDLRPDHLSSIIGLNPLVLALPSGAMPSSTPEIIDTASETLLPLNDFVVEQVTSGEDRDFDNIPTPYNIDRYIIDPPAHNLLNQGDGSQYFKHMAIWLKCVWGVHTNYDYLRNRPLYNIFDINQGLWAKYHLECFVLDEIFHDKYLSIRHSTFSKIYISKEMLVKIYNHKPKPHDLTILSRFNDIGTQDNAPPSYLMEQRDGSIYYQALARYVNHLSNVYLASNAYTSTSDPRAFLKSINLYANNNLSFDHRQFMKRVMKEIARTPNIERVPLTVDLIVGIYEYRS